MLRTEEIYEIVQLGNSISVKSIEIGQTNDPKNGFFDLD